MTTRSSTTAWPARPEKLDIMTLFPTMQLWATWVHAWNKQLLPTRVSSPSPVAREMVTHSRITVPSPMVQ